MTMVGLRMETKMTTSIVLGTLLVIFMSTNQIRGDDVSYILEKTMPAYAIAKNAHILAASNRCRNQLEKFKEGVDNRKIWSLRMLDASGEPKPGFLYGNNFWVGSRTQCVDTSNPDPVVLNPKEMKNNTLYRNPEEETPPYEINYFAAHFTHNGTLQYHERLKMEDVIMMGLCLPDVCRPDELAMILEKIFNERRLSIGSTYSMDFSLLTVKDLKHDGNYLMNWRVMIIGVIVLLTLLLMIVGTCYDLRVHQKRLERNRLCRAGGSIAGPHNGPKPNVENGGPSSAPQIISQPGTLGKIVLCFSAYTNSSNIFRTSEKRSLGCLDGLRFLSMGWIIMVHTALFGLDHTDNNRWSFRLGGEFITQIVTNGSLAVDTYLFLGGFLVTFVFLRSNKKNADTPAKGFRLGELIDGVIKRFFRLTPAYLIVIGLSEISGGYFKETSQYYIFEDLHESCSKYWWRNLLYINNLFKYRELCMIWSWYLSLDMQFFIIGTILLLISRRYLITAFGIGVIILLSSFAVTGYIAYITEHIPTIEEIWHIVDTLYQQPWTRIGPYLIGIATAYILINMKHKLKFKKKTVWFLWILGSACNLLVLFGLYPREFYFSPVPAVIYAAVHRTIWSLGIAWIVIACVTNHGGIVNSILSLKAWEPWGKLTYCAYLLNPLIITSLYLNNEVVLHIDFLANEVLFVGFFGVTFILSYIWSLMFEVPYVHLVKLYYDTRKKT